MDIKIDNLAGNFLIAVPGLDDIVFKETVILICEHTRNGAFGLIVNRILMNSFVPLLSAFDIQDSLVDVPVHYGGPVKPEQGYVIYSPADETLESIRITRDIAVTASKRILSDIAAGKGPEKFLFALGFSGWDANQLEEELISDSWLVAPPEPDIIFNVPVNERWRRSTGLLGIEPGKFINRSGIA